MLGIGLAKELVWVFPYDGTEKLECTFGPTRYMACGPRLSSPQEHSVRDLVGPGPFTVLAPLSAAFDEEPQVSMKQVGGRALGLEHSLWASPWNQHERHF